MKTIAELTDQVTKPTDKVRKTEMKLELTSPLPFGIKKSRHFIYEVEVFNHLLQNKDALGIQSVWKFTNLFLDGAIALSDKRRLAVEVKLRMNWLKACQAEWQFRNFLKRTNEAKTNRVDGALIVFEEFSGDWNKKSGKAKNLWGWEGWYLYYCDAFVAKPMVLVSLRNGKLEGYPV
jgi:hypothetical protein